MRGVPQPSPMLHSMVNMWSVKTVPKAFDTGGVVLRLSAHSWTVRSAAWMRRGGGFSDRHNRCKMVAVPHEQRDGQAVAGVTEIKQRSGAKASEVRSQTSTCIYVSGSKVVAAAATRQMW